ncbi:unnamed protein product [Linum trigynum]|uniref:Uncharacterized protein n=1 Tax=Linum trigynum TaxID=586398 RepID=A0AAV2CFC8_9ROSI
MTSLRHKNLKGSGSTFRIELSSLVISYPTNLPSSTAISLTQNRRTASSIDWIWVAILHQRLPPILPMTATMNRSSFPESSSPIGSFD